MFTNSSVLARVGSTPVNHHARLHTQVILGRHLLVLPISGQFVVAIDGDVPHAADEALLAVDPAADHVVGSCGDIQDPFCFGLLVVDGENCRVLGHGPLDVVPFAIAV